MYPEQFAPAEVVDREFESEPYFSTGPPNDSYMRNCFFTLSPTDCSPAQGRGYLSRCLEASYISHRTCNSVSSHSSGNSSCDSSLSLHTRSTASTTATEPPSLRGSLDAVEASSSGPIIFKPTPIPRGNTFVDELIPDMKTASSQPEVPYPTPWKKKREAGLWTWFKEFFKGAKSDEFDFEARYDIWVKRSREKLGGY